RGIVIFETGGGQLVHSFRSTAVPGAVDVVLTPSARGIALAGLGLDFCIVGLPELKVPEPEVAPPADALALDPQTGYQVQFGRELGAKSPRASAGRFLPDGKSVLSQNTIWDVKSGKQLVKLEEGKPWAAMALYPDGSRAICCGGYYPPNAVVPQDA